MRASRKITRAPGQNITTTASAMTHEGPLFFRVPVDVDATPTAGLVVEGDSVSIVCDGDVCYRTEAAVAPTRLPPAAGFGQGHLLGLRTRTMPGAFAGPIAGIAKIAVLDEATGTVRTGIFFPWREHASAAHLADVLVRNGAEPVPNVDLLPLLDALEWQRSDVDALPSRSTVSSSPEHGSVSVHLMGPMVQAGKAQPMLASHIFSGFPASRSQWHSDAERNALAVLRAVYANAPDGDDDDRSDTDADTDGDSDAGMGVDEGVATGPEPRPPARISVDVGGDVVELPDWAVTRCMLLDLAQSSEGGAGARITVRAEDLPGFPSGVTGDDLRRALSSDSDRRLAQAHVTTSPRGVESAGRVRRVWAWLCCSPSPADRDWAVLNYPDCAGCGEPFRGSAPMSFWDCAEGCTVRRVLCRTCTSDADAEGDRCPVCHGPPLRPGGTRRARTANASWGPGLTLVFQDGQTVEVPAQAIANCAALAHLARVADGEPLATEDAGLPDGIDAAQLRAHLAALGGDAGTTEDADEDRRAVYQWLGCQPGDDPSRARDWTVPNADACIACFEPFCGYAPVRFWMCDARCRVGQQVCRACTLTMCHAGQACPVCRSRVASSLGELVAVKRVRDDEDFAAHPATRRRLL